MLVNVDLQKYWLEEINKVQETGLLSFDDCISAQTWCCGTFVIFFCRVMLPMLLEWMIHQTANQLKP